MTTPTTSPVPSASPFDLLFNAEKIDEAVSSSALTYLDRLGVSRMTLAGAMARISAVNPRGAWATGTVYAARDLAQSAGTWYISLDGHTSGATFAGDQAAHWRVYQGVTTVDLADSSNTANGDALVAVKKTSTGSVATTQHEVNERAYSVFDRFSAAEIADVLSNAGTLDVGPSIRLALAWGVPLRFPRGAYVVDYDPASAFNDGGTTRYSYSIKVPSNAVLIFEDGAIIKQKAGAQKWTRTVTFQGADNVRVFGELRVDANVANIGAATNEHMHGVYLYNTTNTYIERINSQNARGDNVFIGGDNETTFGGSVYIGSIKAVKAGRKNLTLHYCDNLTIGVVDLDNSTGGAAIYTGGVADNTDKHCLDVEPDAFTGSRRFEQTIGRLRTYGMGNDFTAGTTPTHADNWILNIGQAECVQSGSSATIPAWEQNAITINVGSLSISSVAGHDTAVKITYAGRLCGANLSIKGATATSAGFLLSAQASGGDENRPKLSFSRVELVNTNGCGMDLRSAIADFGVVDAQTTGAVVTTGESVSSARCRGGLAVAHLVTRNSGVASTGFILNLTSYTLAGYQVTIKSATLLDTRGTKVGYFANVASGNASGLCIGELINPESIPVCNYLGTDKYYRLAGGPWSTTPRSPGLFTCTGTPEGMVPAMIGSLAMRDDGGAGTSLYVKQAGTGTTGWVGK